MPAEARKRDDPSALGSWRWFFRWYRASACAVLSLAWISSDPSALAQTSLPGQPNSITASPYAGFSGALVEALLYNPPREEYRWKDLDAEEPVTGRTKPGLVLFGRGLPDGVGRLTYRIEGAGKPLHSGAAEVTVIHGAFERAEELERGLPRSHTRLVRVDERPGDCGPGPVGAAMVPVPRTGEVPRLGVAVDLRRAPSKRIRLDGGVSRRGGRRRPVRRATAGPRLSRDQRERRRIQPRDDGALGVGLRPDPRPRGSLHDRPDGALLHARLQHRRRAVHGLRGLPAHGTDSRPALRLRRRRAGLGRGTQGDGGRPGAIAHRHRAGAAARGRVGLDEWRPAEDRPVQPDPGVRRRDLAGAVPPPVHARAAPPSLASGRRSSWRSDRPRP